jgi:hypothetical protein
VSRWVTAGLRVAAGLVTTRLWVAAAGRLMRRRVAAGATALSL